MIKYIDIRYRILILLLIALSLFQLVPVSAATRYYYDDKWNIHTHPEVSLYIDDEKLELDVPPLIVDDRTLVPVRFLFTELGATVSWNDSKREVKIYNSEYMLVLSIDNKKATLNGQTVTMDVPAKIITDINGTARTFVPARFVAEKFDYDVLWDEKTTSVTILTGEKKPDSIKISKINNSVVNSKDVITINLPEEVKPEILTLREPDRLIFDFPGTVLEMGDGATNKSGKYVSNVRYAYHKGLYSRIVLDLSGECKYTTVYSDGVYRITIISAEEKVIYNSKLNALTISSGTVTLMSADNNKFVYKFKVAPSRLTAGTVNVNNSLISTINTTKNGTNAIVTVNAKQRLEHSIFKNNTTTKISFISYTSKQDNILTLKESAKSKKIVIDPGHGGSDPGALGKNEDGIVDLYEKDVNLDVSLMLYDILKNAGADVYITRTDDKFVELLDRSKFANDLEADFFVSVHQNSFTSPDANGSMVFYYADEDRENTAGEILSENIIKELVSELGTTNRGIANGSRYIVINQTKMPAVIVECAFISNQSDKELLESALHREKIAIGIANGIIKTLNGM